MEKNNQIFEMVRIMNECCNVYDEQGRHIRNKCSDCEEWSDDNHCCCSYNRKEAEALYNAGYRKASEVAREIFDVIFEQVLTPEGIDYPLFDELKKKYTESENFNGKIE